MATHLALKRTRFWLVLGLAGIGSIFVLQALVNTMRMLWSHAAETKIYSSSIASVEQLGRISRDIDQERILIDDHIFESGSAEMAQIETRLAEVAADLLAAQRAYAPLIALPNESGLWEEVQPKLGRFERSTANVLALSRKNLGAQARAAILDERREYGAIDSQLGDLLTLNQRAAVDAMSRITALQRSTLRFLLVTRVVGLLGAALLGWWGFVRVSRYEEQGARDRQLIEDRVRELDAFAGRVAHDLRGPLSQMMMTIELLSVKTGGESPPVVDRLRRGSMRLKGIIDDLLTLSRIGAPAEDACCDPAVVAEKIRQEFAERFASEALLRTEVAAAAVPYGDGLFRQAIWNLVDNGVKYRREGVKAEVAISGRAVGHTYELRVSDNGIGMSPEEASRAFEPFYRAGVAQGVGGTGLGLSIVKRVVESKGGKLSIESRPEQGTTFRLELPLVLAGAPPPIASARRRQRGRAPKQGGHSARDGIRSG